MPVQTPILFCIYNRPRLTERVFASIRRARPRRLLVVADGPRDNDKSDARLVEETRQVIDRVDWDCDVVTEFSPKNLGCRRRMSSGIDWGFSQHERLIILEDDCIPNDDFYQYCETLLDRYSDDRRVMMISGNNFQAGPRSSDSYYFSKWTHIWGWASWRRAWNYYDVNLSTWPQVRERESIRCWVDHPQEYELIREMLDRQFNNQIDTWDFAWFYACLAHHGLTILPNHNLVTNIGFGMRATHTTDAESPLANMPTTNLGPIRHPSLVIRDYGADRFTFEKLFLTGKLVEQAANAKQSKSGWPRFLKRLASQRRTAA